ncbi:hypothetical protein KFL_000310440 [Klebsormidium nitens]|uniref:tRNA-splicing endonuclease subunit Sen54 N-terminal domain-containing protein n=1 Tax=Klebsormidium nitens TaxID=105231 RepID=A0A1Y1HLK6_KLENI|nr:hypothetical protein KFL_000310440 [Klebsormidium nitens]|eukprot:GAQ79494.1 hypothetical protein KFL_000310440 [Klebsormidium nitens]
MGIIFGRPAPDGRPARRKKKGAGRRKKKDEFLDSNRKHMDLDEDEEEPKLALKEVYKLLAQRRLATRKTLSVARWHPNRGLAEALVMKGNMWQNMGIVRQGRIFCQPEEALYMVERGSLLLLLGSEPASVQQVHSLLLHQGRPLQAYHVYCNLRKLGYILQRYDMPWVYPVSQNRRKVDGEKKGEETGENGEVSSETKGVASAKGIEGGIVETSKNGGAEAGVKNKKEKEGGGGKEKTDKKEKKEKKGKKEKGDGSKKGQGNGAGSKDGAGNTEESLGGAGGALTEQSANAGPSAATEPGEGEREEGTLSERGIPQEGVQAEVCSGSAEPLTENTSESLAEGTVRDPPEVAAQSNGNDGVLLQDGTLSSARDDGEGSVSSATTKEATIVEVQDADPDSQQDPPEFQGDPSNSEVGTSVPETDLGLSEEAIANAGTEDFRKGPVEIAPTGRKKGKPGPLDLNEASTFVNLNVKNYHPLAPYLFLGQPKKRKRGGPKTEGATTGGDDSPGEAGGETEEATNRGGALASVAAGEFTEAAAMAQGVEIGSGAPETIESHEAGGAPRSDDVTIDIIEPHGEARDALSAPTSADAPDATLLTSPEEAVLESTVDMGALHALLDLSRCTMPPPIPKPSTWQKLRWGLRRALRWRWWPWMWGRGGKRELGTGRTMKPLQRLTQDQPRGTRPAPGRRVFPEVGENAEVSVGSETGGSEQQATEGGGALYPEMWAADEGERLAQIRERRSVVYDVWQPNSRFRKTDPGLPFFRLIIAGTQPPTRKELHLYRELYGEEGVPLKYCFVEVTGASTFFSYETVALPSVV